MELTRRKAMILMAGTASAMAVAGPVMAGEKTIV